MIENKIMLEFNTNVICDPDIGSKIKVLVKKTVKLQAVKTDKNKFNFIF